MHMRQPTCIAYWQKYFLRCLLETAENSLSFRKSSSVAVFYVSMFYFVHNFFLLLYPECFSHVLLFLDFCKWHNILVLLCKSGQHYSFPSCFYRIMSQTLVSVSKQLFCTENKLLSSPQVGTSQLLIFDTFSWPLISLAESLSLMAFDELYWQTNNLREKKNFLDIYKWALLLWRGNNHTNHNNRWYWINYTIPIFTLKCCSCYNQWFNSYTWLWKYQITYGRAKKLI